MAATTLTKIELFRLVWENPMTTLAEKFGVSANGLSKICDRLNIDRPPKGYWSNAGGRGDLPDFDAIDDPDALVEIGGKRHSARRQQSRMPREARQSQILALARQTALDEGVHFVSLRRAARELGISEAQAYNCFATREDLLVELAVEELSRFTARRRLVILRGTDRLSKVIMSTLTYLQEASEHGSLVTNLLELSNVRKRVMERRRPEHQEAVARQLKDLVEDRDVSASDARLQIALFNNFTLRAGELVSRRKISLAEAQQLILPTIIQSASDSRRG